MVWTTLIEHIGEPAFVPALLGLCHEVAGASDLSVFMLEAQAPTPWPAAPPMRPRARSGSAPPEVLRLAIAVDPGAV